MTDHNEVYERAYRKMMNDRKRPFVCAMSGVDKKTFTAAVKKRLTPFPKTARKMVDAMIHYGYFPKDTDPLQVLPPRTTETIAHKPPNQRSEPGDRFSDLLMDWIHKGITTELIVSELVNSRNAHTSNQAAKVVEYFRE